MTATLLDGKGLAQTIQGEIGSQVVVWTQTGHPVPHLAVVLVGDHPASQSYVKGKQAACLRTGIDSQLHRLPADTSTAQLLGLLKQLNQAARVHGILVQLPLPPQIDSTQVLSAVDPCKDVDAFHPENVGLLLQGRPRFLPCTPAGVQQLLLRNEIPTAGQHVVILGRSDIVGKPLAALMMQRGSGGDATVTVCHSRTRHLADITRQADILVAALGQPRFVTAGMVRPGATVIDVGINRTASGLCGDVDFEAVSKTAGWLTPVPGGVGPLTVTMLLANTMVAARLATGG